MPASERDIWRSTKLLVGQHGRDAPVRAAQRADQLLETEPATLADVISRVAADRSLEPNHRRDLCSAVRCLARAIGKNPAELLADGSVLQLAASHRRYTTLGLPQRRWALIRRKARYALIVTGCMDPSYVGRSPLSPPWAKLRARLNTPSRMWPLTRLMRYCTAREIKPTQVTDGEIDKFVRWIVDQGSKQDPHRTHQEICRAWNYAAEHISGWPARRLTAPRHRITVALPWVAFPPSLKADADAWLKRLATGDPLAAVPIRRLRPVTLESYEWLVRYFASALVHRGYDPQGLRNLADLAAVDVIKDGLRYFLDGGKRHSNRYIRLLLTVLKNVARTWARVSKRQQEQLAEMSRACASRRIGLAEESRIRLQPFDNPANVKALVALPQRLADDVERRDNGCRELALEMQIAVAIELLLFCPIKIGILAHLELNRHIRAAGDVRAPTIRMVIPAEEAMSGRDLVFILPAQAAKLVAYYVEWFRPRLVYGRSRWLFPGRASHPKSASSLRCQITATIQRTLGLNVNPFLFRHICAKLFLSRNPENYEALRRILGHTSLATTSAAYSTFETARALRHFDEKVLRLNRADVSRLARQWSHRDQS